MHIRVLHSLENRLMNEMNPMDEPTREPRSEEQLADERSDAWTAVALALLAAAAATFWVSGL